VAFLTSFQDKSSDSDRVAIMDEATFLSEIFDYPEVTLDWSSHTETRDKIAYELLTTERTYTKSLSVLLHVRTLFFSSPGDFGCICFLPFLPILIFLTEIFGFSTPYSKATVSTLSLPVHRSHFRLCPSSPRP
jgi:hypothetical protein